MKLHPARPRRAFTLIELVVTIVVIGLLATIALLAFRANVDRTTESKQRQRTQQFLKEAKALYMGKIYTDPTYTWQQALIDASADLPTYQTNAFADGVSATGGTNLYTGSGGWTIEADTGASVYSSASNEIVFSVSSGVLYVATGSVTGKGSFGMVSQTTSPSVWTAECSGSSCDAASAASGPPSSGAYAPGTTTGSTYAVGDTGPGGGTVFYVSAAPFSCGPTMNLSCTYLEAAPNSWYAAGEDPIRSLSGHTLSNLVTTNTGLGYGHQNTLALVAQSSVADRAITIADSYTNGGKSDWFLPSKVELNELCKYIRQQTTGDTAVACANTGTMRPGVTAAWWWSSSAEAPYAWRQYIGLSNNQVNNADVTAQRSRPIRAG
jgi:prepilin-type N-terminal cleavage/methylation domain-containing protein